MIAPGRSNPRLGAARTAVLRQGVASALRPSRIPRPAPRAGVLDRLRRGRPMLANQPRMRSAIGAGVHQFTPSGPIRPGGLDTLMPRMQGLVPGRALPTMTEMPRSLPGVVNPEAPPVDPGAYYPVASLPSPTTPIMGPGAVLPSGPTQMQGQVPSYPVEQPLIMPFERLIPLGGGQYIDPSTGQIHGLPGQLFAL